MNSGKKSRVFLLFLTVLIIGFGFCIDNLNQWMGKDIEAVDTGISEEETDICIALTFDDGPHPVWTEKLLDGLKERGICATFFVIGENAEKNPELIQKMIENGNQVGIIHIPMYS